MLEASDGDFIHLKCVDGQLVEIDAVAIARSKLIQSLPSLPEEVLVPFKRDDVATWKAFNDDAGSSSFMECISALRVRFAFCAPPALLFWPYHGTTGAITALPCVIFLLLAS